jgi:pimeloyl-ACP methyl ester carboxylesterase
VHGSLDDHHRWEAVIAELKAPGFEIVQLDLPGMRDRAAASGLSTYECVADAVGKPFVIVGHNIGAAIAELVAKNGFEQPSALAAQLDEFLTQSLTGDRGITAAGVRPQDWTEAFASKSAERFGAAFADDVVLEGATLMRPVAGREQVMRVMGAASGIYESLRFTHEATSGPRTYLEWEATALGGPDLKGVTILVRDGSGQVVSAAIHHRPLAASLRFSAELRRRLAGLIDPSHFYGGDETGS